MASFAQMKLKLSTFPSSYHGDPELAPIRIVEECKEFLNSDIGKKVLRINSSALQKFVDEKVDINEVAVSCAKSSPSSSTGETRTDVENGDHIKYEYETRLDDIGRILAYNVVNFSFFPDEGAKPWFISGGIGKDDEAYAITESLKRWEKKLEKGEAGGKDKGSSIMLSSEVSTPSDVSSQDQEVDPVHSVNITTRASSCWRDPSYLLTLTLKDMEKIFEPDTEAGTLPLLEWRLQCLHSLATGYQASGGLEAMLKEMNVKNDNDMNIDMENSKITTTTTTTVGRFVSTVCKYVPAFRDIRRGIEFAKRPQLAASMLHADNLVNFSDIEESITVFSDYRLPQLFIGVAIFASDLVLEEVDWKVMTSTVQEPRNEDRGATTTTLHSLVTSHSPIDVETPLETALRAGTIVAAAELLQKLKAKYPEREGITMANLDYYLWRTAVDLDGKKELPPFHRTRTYCY
ncbi:unnamed protein product [Amoebophrya sp. A25]|nr:unnamed protein product [Amoebophrya sp. A25]|eukprot:GSA25T00021040001.1